MRLSSLSLAAVLASCLAGAPRAQPVQLTGAGSTFAAPLYASISQAMGEQFRFRLAYDAVGSGEGTRRIIERRVDFGASDRPLPRKELDERGLLQFPVSIGGVVLTANLPGVDVAQLRLDAATAADLYLGRITSWNDPRLAALNPGLALPRLPVTPIYRSDSSGTSWLFSSWLARRHEGWRSAVGATNQIRLPPSTGSAAAVGAVGNGGVVRAMGERPGTLGYLEFGYAQENGFAAMPLKNAFGSWVRPGPESLDAAVRAADWELMYLNTQPTFEIDSIDVGCPRCWPIVGITYTVVPRRFADPDKAAAFVRFMQAMLDQGDALARDEGHVPLPNRAKNLVRITLQVHVAARNAPAAAPTPGRGGTSSNPRSGS